MKQRDTLFIFISCFLLVLAWIAFSVYNAIATSTISDTLSVQIAPIDPTFDTATIDRLKNRVHIDPLYQTTQSAILTPTLVPSAAPTLTPSETQTLPGEPSPTQQPIVTTTPSGPGQTGQ